MGAAAAREEVLEKLLEEDKLLEEEKLLEEDKLLDKLLEKLLEEERLLEKLWRISGRRLGKGGMG